MYLSLCLLENCEDIGILIFWESGLDFHEKMNILDPVK